jgi:hypothetical protein
MIKLALINLLFISSLTLVQAEELTTSCETEIKIIGLGKGLDTFSAECQDYFMDNKLLNVKKSIDNTTIEVSYFPGVLILDKTEGEVKYREFIAGEYTKLPEVDDIAINMSRKEVALLSKIEATISTYSTYIAGNVSPQRVLRNPDFINASKIEFNNDEEKILVLNSELKSLCYFNRNANSFQRKEMRKDTALECKTNKTSIEAEDL